VKRQIDLKITIYICLTSAGKIWQIENNNVNMTSLIKQKYKMAMQKQNTCTVSGMKVLACSFPPIDLKRLSLFLNLLNHLM